MKERRKQERRRWGRKVTYPFIDSEGVLVTKNRRRKIDRRDVTDDDEAAKEEATTPAVAAKSKQESKNTSLDISESKVMELEEALQDKNEPASSIVESIKDLEEEILDATNVDAISKDKFDSGKDATPEQIPTLQKEAKKKQVSKPEKTTKAKISKKEKSSIDLPEIDAPVNGNTNGKDNNYVY